MENKNLVRQKNMPTSLGLFDRFISIISPKMANSRLKERVKLESSLDAYSSGNLNSQGYITNQSNQRNMRGWIASANDANLDILPKKHAITASCRDLWMNAPVARGIIERFTVNVVGGGLRMKSQIDREFLGFTGEDGQKRATQWERNTERLWEMWSSSMFSDAELQLNIHENASLAFRNMLLSGDCFVALPGRSLPGQDYDLKVKVIESDFVANPTGTLDTLRMAQGVESDAFGAPIAYHFRKPRDDNFLQAGTQAFDEVERIARFSDDNLQQILHLFQKERPGLKRGVGILAPVIEEIKELTRYQKAEVDAAILNSMYTVFIKSVENTAGKQQAEGYFPPSLDPLNIGDSVITQNGAPPQTDNLYQMGRANILEMDVNQDISLADPKHPIMGYEKFFKAVVEEIAMGVGLPFETLMQSFNSSFSASKAALQEAWKMFLEFRQYMVQHYYKPIYENFMVESIVKGFIEAPSFFDSQVTRSAWLKAAWIGRGQGMIDPKKETEAALMRIEGRLSTREAEFQKINTGTNGDWSSEMENFAKEDKILEELNIKPAEALPVGAEESNPNEEDD